MSILTGLTAKKLTVPLRVLVYGQAGIGKSTFAAGAPSPIFVGAEDGTSELEVVRYPVEMQSGDDILAAIDTLEKDEHAFKTVVLDTVDWAEPLVWESVLRAAGKSGKGIESIGYGKGWTNSQEFWFKITRRLDQLRHKRGMHVVLLGHSVIRTFKNPEGDDYDMWTLKMHEKSAGVLREWSDDVLFAKQEKYTNKGEGLSKAKVLTDGARSLHTTDKAAFFAKNRHNLPGTLPLDWGAYWSAVQESRPEKPDITRRKIRDCLEEYALYDLDGVREFAAKVDAATAAAGDDSVRLGRVLNTLMVRLNEKRGSNGENQG